MINPVKALFDEVNTALVDVAPSLWFAREGAANGIPPRFVWVPGGGKVEAARSNGRNPRPLGQIAFKCAVVCWGEDDDDAWRLLSALLSVLPRVVQGRNYEIGQVAYTQPAWVSRGVSITVEVSMLVIVLEQDFDSVAAPGGDGSRTLQTVNPTTSEPESVAVSTPGDGFIENNES